MSVKVKRYRWWKLSLPKQLIWLFPMRIWLIKMGKRTSFHHRCITTPLCFCYLKQQKCWFTFAWCTCDHFLKTFSEMLVKCNFVQPGVWFGFVFFLTWFTMDSLLLTLILFIFALISNLNPHRIERHKQRNC